MSWGLSHFYDYLQLECLTMQCDIQCAQVIKCFSITTSVFSNYLFCRNFYFHIYHENFFGLSNDILLVLELHV